MISTILYSCQGFFLFQGRPVTLLPEPLVGLLVGLFNALLAVSMTCSSDEDEFPLLTEFSTCSNDVDCPPPIA